MRRIGFSTGALAKGDFRKGIELQSSTTDAIELSALREDELDPLIEALPDLKLHQFKYVSLHAPSRLKNLSERELVARLQKIVSLVRAIIVHPDVIKNPEEWRSIEHCLVLENMDQRKPGARVAGDFKPLFAALPKARFCFDLGHALQVDPTMGVAVEFLRTYSDRLAEIHISEVDTDSQHVAISSSAMESFRRLSSLIPNDTPAIVESIVPHEDMDEELEMARKALEARSTPRTKVAF